MVSVNLVVENAELDVDVCMPYGPYETKYLKNIDGSKIGNVYDFCFFNKISKILDFWKKTVFQHVSTNKIYGIFLQVL